MEISFVVENGDRFQHFEVNSKDSGIIILLVHDNLNKSPMEQGKKQLYDI